MKNISEINMNYRLLTSEERSVLFHAIIERAHRERSEFLRSLVRALYRRYDRAIEWMLRLYFSSRLPPVRSRHG